MQPARERKAGKGATLAEEPSRHFLASPGSGGSAPSAQGQPGGCPSGRGFWKRKFPFWLKRKEPLQGQAVSRSRLCLEDAHESPIQAFRRAAPRGQPWAADSDDDSTAGRMGPSLLRKLLCLKAKPAKLQQPRWGVEASPLRQAGGGCGPVAALSRTANPHGESPLRWKPRAEAQSPSEAATAPEPEQTGPGSRPEGSCTARPWRVFRTLLSSRAKKGSVLPGRERSHRTAKEGNPGPSPGPDTAADPQGSWASKEQQSNPVAAGDKAPRPASPPGADGPCRIREEKEGPRTPWQGLERHGHTGGLSEPAPQELSGSREEDSRRGEEPLGSQPASERDFLQRRVSEWSGEGVGEAGGGALEDSDTEGLAGGNLDLADLAENPGGQGMVMGTRDLGWLANELLGGPASRPGGRRTEAFAKRAPDACEAGGGGHAGSRAMAPEEEERPGPGPVPAAQRSSLPPSPPSEITGGHTQSPLLGFPPESDPPPSLKLHPVPGGSSGGAACQPPGNPTRTPLAPTAPEDAQSKRQLYRAAAEIVGAAIDAAAEQLVRKDGREQAWSRGLEDSTAAAPTPGPATGGGAEIL